MRLSVDLSLLLDSVRKMGAELREFDIGHAVTSIDPIDIELEKGFELQNLDGIETSNGLLSYEGRQVLLYIQDQGRNVEEAILDGSKGRKFHVADCRTLSSMREAGRFERYVVTNKLDGIFYVTGISWPSRNQKEGEARLWVCQNCLKALNYKGAQNGGARDIARDFSIEEFFSTYSSFFPHLPKRIAGDQDQETYTADWARIAGRFKAEVDFKCDSCGVVLMVDKNLLHVHHRNGVKGDNNPSNLRALCVACHRAQPAHASMFVNHSDMKRISSLRRSQGLLTNPQGRWDEILKLCDPGLAGLLEACRAANSVLPEVGLDIQDDTDTIVAELELAWPDARLGVAIGEDDRSDASRLGWEVWTMFDALTKIEQFVEKTRDRPRR